MANEDLHELQSSQNITKFIRPSGPCMGTGWKPLGNTCHLREEAYQFLREDTFRIFLSCVITLYSQVGGR